MLMRGKVCVFMDDKNLRENIEDTTKYGEFVSSYFGWIAPSEQKEKVEKLENITKKEDKERKNNRNE